jgi:hypothetical protein
MLAPLQPNSLSSVRLYIKKEKDKKRKKRKLHQENL